nr:hypothetical protein Iba_chr12fCG9960 [Ipomoea batatas]
MPSLDVQIWSGSPPTARSGRDATIILQPTISLVLSQSPASSAKSGGRNTLTVSFISSFTAVGKKHKEEENADPKRRKELNEPFGGLNFVVVSTDPSVSTKLARVNPDIDIVVVRVQLDSVQSE